MFKVGLMAADYKPIYGLVQYPHMDFYLHDNPCMDIERVISTNLSAWMSSTPSLDTDKKLSVRAKIGFGTVQRARNGTGNITVRNLDAIARAFGRRVTDLLTVPVSPYATTAPNAAPLLIHEKLGEPYFLPARRAEEDDVITQVVTLMTTMDDAAKGMLLERAVVIAESRPQSSKANRA